MDKESIIQKTADHVKEQMLGDGSGHDWWHVYRVWKTAIHIAEKEKADMFIVQLAALLHDLADWKLYKGDDLKPVKDWLETLEIDNETADLVCEIVKNVSFKGAGVRSEITKTKEGMVVQDADRLDAIGAIGIARALAYGGHKGREIHNPDTKPVKHKTFEEYKSSKGTTINHFYEKLLLLKDRMKTETGKKMA
ncbi:HD domain-containing protein, partial [Candidatus Woesearchaeota archaeon]|nr:HD domain-containing protein [Candidatus Woesearchaeota archaeon]